MRKLLTLLAALVLGVSLAACGGSDSGSKAGSASKSVAEATGKFGEKPTVKHREGDPDKSLVTEVLSEGNGPVVKKGELLVANYLGQIWRDNKVFDNSYDRGVPAAFTIGTGAVIKGWDEALVGKKIGSRVLLSIPADKGYGPQGGNQQAGITKDDTLLFVVDLVNAYESSQKAQGTPQPQKPGGIQVTGPTTAAPKVTVPKGTKPPAKPGAPIVVAKGTGKPIPKNSLGILNYVVYDYTGKAQASTWVAVQGQPAGPQGIPIGASQAGPLDGLVSLPIGSRVLIHLPKQANGPAAFAVIDVVDAVTQTATS